MPCYTPFTAYRSREGKNKSGKHPIVFNRKNGIPGSELEVACGMCAGCRLEKSRMWAMRCMHEAKLHQHNQFLTITYNDENIPSHGTLFKPDLQRFWKRLRRRGHDVRYYACGEYGDTTDRPHYHAIAFNLRLDDKAYLKTDNGNKIYTSAWLDRVWSHGHVYIGTVSFESCAYVARYVMKKVIGLEKQSYGKKLRTDPGTGLPYISQLPYERCDTKSGEVYEVEPEFQAMSRNPGIGRRFYEKYKTDMYRPGVDGQCITRGGMSSKPPAYYELAYESESEENVKHVETIKERRVEYHEAQGEENSEARRAVKNKIMWNRANKALPRKQH